MGNKKRLVPQRPIARALGTANAEVLPGFRAFSGAHTTSQFAVKEKLSCWQAADVLWRWYLHLLPWSSELSQLTLKVSYIETFVCQLYEPGTTVVDASNRRWKLIAKKQLQAQKLSPSYI